MPRRSTKQSARPSTSTDCFVDGDLAPAGASASLAASNRLARESITRRPGFAKEAGSVLLVAAALYTALALASFEAHPLRPELHGEDWVGPVGSIFSELAVTYLGLAAWLIPVQLFSLALPLMRGTTTHAKPLRFVGDAVIALVVSALIYISWPQAQVFGEMPIGGFVGEVVGEISAALFSMVGSFIIGLTVVALILVRRASFSFIAAARAVASGLANVSERTSGWMSRVGDAWAHARTIDRGHSSEQDGEGPAIMDAQLNADAIIAALAGDDDADGLTPAARGLDAPIEPETPLPASVHPEEDLWQADAGRCLEDVPTPSPILPAPRPVAGKETKRTGLRIDTTADSDSDDRLEKSAEADADEALASEPTPRKPPRKPRKKDEAGIRIVDTSAALKTEKATAVARAPRGFVLPPTDLLSAPGGDAIKVDELTLKQTAQLLEKTLADYGVSGRVEEIHPGPTVTTFEVSPAPGTKVSKVAGLADDLALGLSRKVRIIAPIPGKNRIGFEIPNEERVPVSLRELVEDRRFVDMKQPLPCVLGRDIVGAPYFADLHSMPHMIVAGATGAGKSVGLNVILVSLLSRRSPEELRLLMVDPKVVELAPFDGIPHMLLPVVTDMKQASNALKWAVDEMERRYQLFANAGTKNITTYNNWSDRVARGEIKPPKKTRTGEPKMVEAIAPDGTAIDVPAAEDGSDEELPERLSYIVIVIDEFADLMMQQGKDVEASVARLAQKARAAGMHVILATQRPSVDVITGMIKANFPTRIAFRVAQKVDSRTILDEQGAEHLLGRGDMLVKMNGSNETRRVQCPFVSEEEVQAVTDHLRAQGTPVYDESILKPRDDDGAGPAADDAEMDPLYDQAVAIVAETRRCSTSWIQRKLGVGYNRAAKIVETMERLGVVGPPNGSKDREILVEAH